jgi:UDP-N-acetylmuramoyl-tripeptide--D-alanyl-D-alanine ligase
MFAALPGARADGHDFAAQALAAGAACVLASRPVNAPAVVVPGVTAALGALARHVLRRLTDATVIALTGSSGKTTTKDMLRHVLSQHGPVIAPQGSYNTEIDLPLTVLQADRTTRYLVLEMGTRHLGDIRYLTTLAPPQIGIVLNVGSAHIGEFGSRQAIAQAKAALVEALPAAADGGIAILNADDPFVAAMAARTAAKTVRYGTSQADIRAAGISLSAGRASFTLHTPAGTIPVNLRLLGAHQVHNALAVAAAAHTLGMGTAQIAAAPSTAEPSPGRLQILDFPGGITLINDAFNANPESMTAGLRSFAAYAGTRRSVAVLGEMRELGPDAQAARHAIGELVAELGIHLLITVGNGHADDLARAAQSSPAPPVIETAQTPKRSTPHCPECSNPMTSCSSRHPAQSAWKTSRPCRPGHRPAGKRPW